MWKDAIVVLFEMLCRKIPEGNDKNQENPHASLSSCWNLNLRPTEHEAGLSFTGHDVR
jgi:hypothetical protein